jgi:hypothetical protein
MKPEVNAVLAEVKAQMNSMDNATPQPKVDINALRLPDFKAMSIMEATKWCIEKGITSPKVIAQTTGKVVNTVNTALWKIRNPKRVKMLSRRAKKVRDLKAGIVKEGVKATKPKAKVAKVAKVAKPKITNGLYDDGMDTPWRDAIQRQGGNFDFLKKQNESGVHYLKDEVDRLRKEVQRLTIIVEYYEGKAGK